MKKLLLTCLSLVPAFLSAQSPTPAPRETQPRPAILRDANGQIIGRVEPSATGYIVRDANGQIIARLQKPKK